MNDRQPPVVNKLPFLIADLVLLGSAAVLVQFSRHPLSFNLTLLCVGLVILGAIFSILPFLLQYKAAVRLAESDKLHDTVAQIQKLELLAKQISTATAQWQDVQTASGKSVGAAREIAARMDEELKSFAEFVQKANDSEKSALRLEVEKLRRSEGEWLQIVVRILDHIFALHLAGIRSGNPELVEQLSHFQNACRDVARRIGVTAFAAASGEAFDEKRHKLLNNEKPAADARVAETIAPGFTFQSQLIRPALVKLKSDEPVAVAPVAPIDAAEPEVIDDPGAEPAPAAPAPASESDEPTLL